MASTRHLSGWLSVQRASLYFYTNKSGNTFRTPKNFEMRSNTFPGSRKALSDGLALVDVGECTSLVLSESKARKCMLRRMTLLLPLIQVMRIPRNTEGYEAGT